MLCFVVMFTISLFLIDLYESFTHVLQIPWYLLHLVSFIMYDNMKFIVISSVIMYIILLLVPDMVQFFHYYDVMMGAMASQITSLTIVYSTVYSDADQSKHQSYASLVRGIHPVNSLHKWPVTRKLFPLMTSSWTNENKYTKVWTVCIILDMYITFVNPRGY